MSIKVIGVGFGRTGTLSLKAALTQLGYSDCYHMFELFSRPGHAKIWQGIASGEQPNWPEHIKFYPEAKVILTVRDPDAWYDSIVKTIFTAIEGAFPASAKTPQIPDGAPDFAADQIIVAKTLIADRLFKGRLHDRDFCISVYNRHNEEVQNTVPANKLLVFEVKEGWAPLCKFLDTTIPEMPFPRSNMQEEFSRLMKIP
ncbi:MAG: sulfotransferase family protein [Porticoccaceae bacterium]